MGIGKGKSDKIDIDGLIEGVGNENKVAQEESKLEQKIKELKDVRLELEAATRKMEEVTFALKTATDSADNIISGICRAIVKAEQNIVFRAKISTDELAKVHQCTVRHIKAEEDLLERHSDKKFGDSKNKSKSIGKTAQKIIDFVISDPSMSTETMAYKIGISSRAVEKHISKLRSMGILSREGADHDGYWRIIVKP